MKASLGWGNENRSFTANSHYPKHIVGVYVGSSSHTEYDTPVSEIQIVAGKLRWVHDGRMNAYQVGGGIGDGAI